jgi:hypothetical protein
MPAMHVIGVSEGQTPPGVDDRPWWAKCNDDRKDKQPVAGSAPIVAPPSAGCHQKYAGVQTEKEVVVNVSDDSGPIVLALTAYNRTLWKVSLASGVKLTKVVLGGYHTQRVSGIPAETPIETYTHDPSPCERCWQGSEHFYSYQKPPEKLMEVTGLDVTSFQGRDKGTEFFIFSADESLKRDKDVALVDVEALKRDKDAALAAVRKSGRALKNASPALQDDEEVVEAAVMARDTIRVFQYASPRLKRDAEFILKMLNKGKSQCCISMLEHVDASLKNDKGFMSKALAINVDSLRYGGEAIKKDKEIGLYAISRDHGNGGAFAQLDITLKDDIDVAWAAIKRNGGSYRDVSDRLKENRDLALAAVKGGAFRWKHIAQPLKDDLGFVREVVAMNPEVIEYMDEKLQQDKAIVLIASSHSKEAEKLIKGSFRRDKDVVLAAIEKSDGALPLLLDESFQRDEAFIRSAVRKNGRALRYAPAEFIKDKEIVLAAVRNSGIALAFAGKVHQQDRDIVLAAVKQDWRALAYADKALRNDPDIVSAAARQNARALIYTDPAVASQVGRELGIQVDSEQFIGEISPVREHIRVDSSVLTPDGKRLYVLKNGTLSQYQIDPFRLMSSFKVGIDSVQPEKRSDWYQIFITPDESKIVIHDKSSIKLLDLTTRGITKSVTHESQNGLLVDNVFVTFGPDNVLTLWNAESLQKIKTIVPDYKWTGTREVSHDEGTRFPNAYSLSRGSSNVFRLGDQIVIYIPAYIASHAGAAGDIFLIDKDTFELEAYIQHHSEDPTLSFDHKSIYVNGLKLREPSKENAKVEKGGFWDIQKYDLESGDVTVVKPEKSPNSNAPRLSFRGLSPQIPPAGQFHLLNRQVLASPESKDATKSLYVYENGEAVLFNNKRNAFELTENARKYLGMKVSKDEVIPVNDATFEKFVVESK